jgi:ribosomal protein S18 acetylase RimI-like enzyme
MGAAARGPAGIQVRPVRPEEWAEAGRETRAGFAALFGETDHEYLDIVADIAERSGRTTVLVAIEEGRILGSVTLELTRKVDPERQLAPDEAHLRMLGVSPAAQGRGVGRALVEAAAALARAAGKRRLTLGTLPEMAAARRLYEGMGFRGGPPVELAEGRTRLTYELLLAPGAATPDPQP